MKLAIAFLLTCAASLASSDVQKRQALFWAPNYQPSGQFYYAPHLPIYRLPYGSGKAENLMFPGDTNSIKANPFGEFNSEKANPRFFINKLNSNNNPGFFQPSNGAFAPDGGIFYFMNRFFGPTYFTTTLTVNNAMAVACIPRNNFVAGSESNICPGVRGRREVIELLDQLDDGFDISPSHVQRVDVTASPRMIDVGSHLQSGNAFEGVASSQLEESSQREKRTFSFFLPPTVTVTAYEITSTMVTQTLQLLQAGSNSQLVCRPSTVAIC